MLETLRNLFRIPELRTKILYTLFFLFIYRIGSHIPIPGIDVSALKSMLDNQNMPGGSLGGVLNIFSTLTGGALANCAIFSLGIMPYISASIIFSLLVKVIPSLEAISKEGPSGQRKINEYTRYATLPLCLLQSWMIVKLFQRPVGGVVLAPSGWVFELTGVLCLTTGAIFLMWIGEQITEYGIGNGISLLIMAGIVAQMPVQIGIMLTAGGDQGTEIRNLVLLLAVFVVVVAAVVYMTYGQRKITIQQAKLTRGRRVYGGQRHFLPLKVNQAGVMPVIFASSVLVFPMTIISMLGADASSLFNWQGFWYIFFYILMIFFFSYFWTSLMFQPAEMANNLKEYGSFIPGIRPGKRTAEYLEKVMTRITFVGAAFLALIALIPQFLAMGLDLGGVAIGFAFNLGGTSILIVVGVILDMIQKFESHLLMRHYDGFVKEKS